jgi:hypothetical protein
MEVAATESIKKPRCRSSEELEMRALIVPELRKRYPSARIIHELPLRYSSNRIDLAAITESEIMAVEIKSSKDVADRLEKQLRTFTPVSSRIIVALAPKWNEKLEAELIVRENVTTYRQRLTDAQEIIHRVENSSIETWTVDVAAGSINITDRAYRDSVPWSFWMLDMCHVAELVAIAGRHRCWSGKRPVHRDLVLACCELMTGREIRRAVCSALRARAAFGAESDPAQGTA